MSFGGLLDVELSSALIITEIPPVNHVGLFSEIIYSIVRFI